MDFSFHIISSVSIKNGFIKLSGTTCTYYAKSFENLYEAFNECAQQWYCSGIVDFTCNRNEFKQFHLCSHRFPFQKDTPSYCIYVQKGMFYANFKKYEKCIWYLIDKQYLKKLKIFIFLGDIIVPTIASSTSTRSSTSTSSINTTTITTTTTTATTTFTTPSTTISSKYKERPP